jgi:HPt (histidine-containing phosphotransfer) domain-containing protein
MQDLASTQHPGAAAIDLAHLDRATFSDRTFRDEVRTLFMREAKALLERLAAAPSDADWRLAAHTLKGMAWGIGATPLAEAAAAAEPLVNGVCLERRGEALTRLWQRAAEATTEAERLITGPDHQPR